MMWKCSKIFWNFMKFVQNFMSNVEMTENDVKSSEIMLKWKSVRSVMEWTGIFWKYVERKIYLKFYENDGKWQKMISNTIIWK